MRNEPVTRMATRYVPSTDAEGKDEPIAFACFIKYKDMYFTKDGKWTTEKKSALVIPKRRMAKNFINKSQLKGCQIVSLTQEDFDELYPKPQSVKEVK